MFHVKHFGKFKNNLIGFGVVTRWVLYYNRGIIYYRRNATLIFKEVIYD